MSSKQNIKYPHRCQAAKCRGKMPEPRRAYGTWAHWHPGRAVWLSMPVCPACLEVKTDFKANAGPGNSYSRYASTYICSACGFKEAVQGFFWRGHCNPVLIKEHHR